MSRRTRRARTRRRKRRVTAAPSVAMPGPLTETDRRRALQRFSCLLVRRQVVLQLTVWGPVVTADSPEQLVENTNVALIALVRNELPS